MLYHSGASDIVRTWYHHNDQYELDLFRSKISLPVPSHIPTYTGRYTEQDRSFTVGTFLAPTECSCGVCFVFCRIPGCFGGDIRDIRTREWTHYCERELTLSLDFRSDSE